MTNTLLQQNIEPTQAIISERRTENSGAVCVALLRDLKPEQGMVVHLSGKTIALFLHQGQVFAVDNRCPHMGFPLHKGSVQDGILTCHWHHARFELSCGGTFDLWADDVRRYPTEIRGEGDCAEVWLDPEPPTREPLAWFRQRLHDGMKYNLNLVIAKAVIGLFGAGDTGEIALQVGAEFGTRYSSNGWGAGLTILTAMANILPALRPEDRPRALYQGLTSVARECAGMAPRFPMEPLPMTATDADTLKRWFREFVERRDTGSAERCLRTAIEAGLPQEKIADMLFAACTDHLYRGTGHPLDFTNKAFELLDIVGTEQSGDILTSLVGQIVNGARLEESSAWRHPIDLAQLLWNAFPRLPEALEAGRSRTGGWQESNALAETLLRDDPAAAVDTLTAALCAGATPLQLSETVVYAAARRVAQFHTSNEFGDWITVLHTFTYANAVHQAMRRVPSVELLRGVYDAAMSIYLSRFLNTPPVPMPRPTAESVSASAEQLMPLLDRQQQTNPAGTLIANLLTHPGAEKELLASLGEGLLREDAEFHTFQGIEAAFRQYGDRQGTEWGTCYLVASARYLAAHCPTPRATGQTYQIALRLHRGEALYEG